MVKFVWVPRSESKGKTQEEHHEKSERSASTWSKQGLLVEVPNHSPVIKLLKLLRRIEFVIIVIWIPEKEIKGDTPLHVVMVPVFLEVASGHKEDVLFPGVGSLVDALSFLLWDSEDVVGLLSLDERKLVHLSSK